MLRVGVIGAGAIGGALARQLLAGEIEGCRLVALVVRRPRVELAEAPAVRTCAELMARLPDVVVEAAGHTAVREYGEAVLTSGCKLVCMSVGALADPGLRTRLERAARSGETRLIVPSGAVGALDMLRAAARGGLDDVLVEQRKSPLAVLPPEERDLASPRAIFSGSAAEAARRFPATTNIMAAVALAGIGFERTRCRVVADPRVNGARVSVRARGAFGQMSFAMSSAPSPNPRTSAIAAMSAAAVLEGLSDPIATLA